MDDPFDRGRWPLPGLAVELDDLAARSEPSQGEVDMAAAGWAIDQLSDGADPRDLCEAAMWVGLRRARVEGRGPAGLLTHSVIAGPACAAIGEVGDGTAAAMAAVQHVAYTLGAYRGGVNDQLEGPHQLAWCDPRTNDGDTAALFLEAAERGECQLADHRWLAAAEQDPVAAEHALVAAGAAGYHLNEHKLIYPAQLRAWVGDRSPLDPVLFRAAARYAGNHVQDRDRADARRADAAAIAMEVDAAGGAAHSGGDPERVSVVATGIARTAPEELGPLLMGSLANGLNPDDLVLAVSLVTAARHAATSTTVEGMIGAVHAGTGANAVRRCLARTSAPELRYELAICSTEGPHLRALAGIEELVVPPHDDEALEDLLEALRAGDPDGAAEAASAVPLADEDALTRAWSAVAEAAAADQWMLLHGAKHVVAMWEEFRATDHPARIWYLAAASRTAASAVTMDQPVAREVARRL